MSGPKAIGEAPGKVLLFGEHAVVYGEPALGMAISRRVRAELLPGTGRLQLHLPRGPDLEVSRTTRASPEALIQKALGPLRTHVDVTLDLGVPPMRGLGSSAAVAVALLRARAAWMGEPEPGPRKLIEDALAIETVAHARPSGVDPAICAHGVLIRFVTRQDRRSVRRLRMNKPVFFIVGSVGSHGGTARSVSRIAELKKTDRALMRSAMTTLGEATRAGERGLLNHDLERVGRAMDLAHGVLRGLGLVSAGVDKAIEIAREAGGLGAKMSGAGGDGGAFIALFSSETKARRVARQLVQKMGNTAANAWVERLG